MPITETLPKPEAKLPGENPASAGIGHNNPPPEEQVAIDFREAMIDKHPTYEQRIDDLAAAAERCAVTDAETAGKAGDLVKSIRAMSGAVADAHKTVKQPYLDAGRVADQMKNGLTVKLDAAKRTVEGKQTEFLRAEEAKREAARREAQAEAQRQAEAAAEAERKRLEAEGAGDVEALAEVEVVAAPAVVAKAPEPIRSADTGVVVSGQKKWECQVEDYELAVISMLDDPKIKEAIDACAARRVRAGIHQIEGVRIWQATVARTY